MPASSPARVPQNPKTPQRLIANFIIFQRIIKMRAEKIETAQLAIQNLPDHLRISMANNDCSIPLP